MFCIIVDGVDNDDHDDDDANKYMWGKPIFPYRGTHVYDTRSPVGNSFPFVLLENAHALAGGKDGWCMCLYSHGKSRIRCLTGRAVSA